ncbi:hypothetical protein [Lysinibacillus fusiformis]
MTDRTARVTDKARVIHKPKAMDNGVRVTDREAKVTDRTKITNRAIK